MIIIDILAFILIVFLLVFSIALCTMQILNPTASVKEIFEYWTNNFKKNRSEGKLF